MGTLEVGEGSSDNQGRVKPHTCKQSDESPPHPLPPSTQDTYRSTNSLYDNQGTKLDAKGSPCVSRIHQFNLRHPCGASPLCWTVRGVEAVRGRPPRAPLPDTDSQQRLQGTVWALQGLTQHLHPTILQGVLAHGEKLQLLVVDDNRGDVFAGFTRDVTLPQPAGETGGGGRPECLQGVCPAGPGPPQGLQSSTCRLQTLSKAEVIMRFSA